MIRFLATIALLIGSGATFLAAYVHPVSASGEYHVLGQDVAPGLQLDWFWKKPVQKDGSTFGVVNANPEREHEISIPNVLLRTPDPSSTQDSRAALFKSVILGRKAVTPAATALATLKSAAIEAEAVALEQEQRLSKRTRSHLNNQLNLKAQQEITYAAKLKEFKDKLLKIENNAQLAIAVRAAETDALSDRAQADIDLGRQRLQALRDGLIADALRHEGAKNFMRMEVIRYLGAWARSGDPMPTAQTIETAQKLIDNLEAIGHPDRALAPNRAQRAAAKKR